MGFVKVRNLDPQLLAVNGEYMHVFEDRVARGVAAGIWEVVAEEAPKPTPHDAFALAEERNAKAMTAAPGKGYATKDVLSYRDVHGEDKKA
jgi:hypothetical protein